MLSPAQVQARDGKLTASRVACLMTGDADKIMNLWRELVGDPAFVPEDLSDVWAVQLGSWTEPFNLDWYEKRTGKPLSRRGEVVNHPRLDWAAATLDAWDTDLQAPVECKHVGGFEKTAAILERYAPQAHWQMMVTGARQCVFSIIEGAREPVIEIVDKDDDYARELLARAEAFMRCVFDMTPPVALPAVAPPTKAEKIYHMQGDNFWASNAVTWLTTRQAAKDFAACERDIKASVPADAAKCHGHGIQVTRNKIGSLSIRELKE
jgi:predicted phage-related endonuclease